MIARLILLLALAGPMMTVGQSYGVDHARRDFFELRSQLRAHYDNLLANDPNALEFAEGGAYEEFKRWEEYWSTRMPWGRTFEEQAAAAEAAYQTLGAKKSARRAMVTLGMR